MNHCPRCGERVEPEDAYCFECGTELGDRPEGEGTDRQRRKTGRNPQRGNEYEYESRSRPERDAYGESDSSQGEVESLTTLWIAGVLAAIALVENVVAAVFADEIVEFLDDQGFAGGLNPETIVIQGGLGAVLALVLAGVCFYYYRQGYVNRRFFWTLVAGGVLGILLGSAISFLLLLVVGAYGLLVVLRRDRSRDRPVGDVDRR
jgi:hypothetical protein